MNASGVNVSRLIRIATLSLALLAGTLVYLTYQPAVEVLERRLADDISTLRSDETVLHTMPQLRTSRDALARQYATLFAQNPEAVFLRDLSAASQRHGVTLVSTSVARSQGEGDAEQRASFFAKKQVDVQMRGSYTHLLGAIGDLSVGSEIVRVDAPTMRRDNADVAASIPVTLFEPGVRGDALR